MNLLKYRTTIQLSITASLLVGITSHAAGLEYTKQSILPFFEPGNYAELSYAYVDPKIEGTDVAGGVDNPAANQKINDMMDDFEIWGGAVKIAPTENTALALIYDEPFGVDTIYSKGSEFNNNMGATEARVDTRSLTLLGGGKVNNNFWVYGGVEYQEADGGVQLAQNFEGFPIYYSLDIKNKSDTLIPVLGVAYEKPEIMLRAALTWRGEGEHKLKGHESLYLDFGGNTPEDFNDSALAKAVVGVPDDYTLGNTNLSFKTPQSVNFDFQTGLSEKYQLLGMINARWVEWTKFNISPQGITTVVGEPLAEYKEDAYAVEVALAKQFTPKFAGEIRAGYDSGTAEPLSLLGPYDSIKTLALGGSYDVTKQLKLSAGAQYMWFEGGTAYSKLPIEKTLSERTLAKFDDGTGYALGVKLGYYF